MLEVNNVEVVYMNVIQVLRGVSLEVGDIQIVALLLVCVVLKLQMLMEKHLSDFVWVNVIQI